MIKDYLKGCHYKLFLFSILIIIETKIFSQLIDIDNNSYRTVQIGEQIWMGENLKVKHYNDGAAIKMISDSKFWEKDKDGAYCYYDNDTNNINRYGLLYNGYVLINDNICPTGWRLPNLNDWLILIKNTGGYKVSGGKIKTLESSLWSKDNIIINEYNTFSALPSGLRMQNGKYDGISLMAYFWTWDITNNSKKATSSFIENWDTYFNILKNNRNRALSIRCLKK